MENNKTTTDYSKSNKGPMDNEAFEEINKVIHTVSESLPKITRFLQDNWKTLSTLATIAIGVYAFTKRNHHGASIPETIKNRMN